MQLLSKPENRSTPSTGRLSFHFSNWVSVTDNTFVLEVVKNGLKLHFHTLPPMLTLSSSPFSPSRSQSISAEISSLHNKSAIAPIIPDDNQFVSPIFDVPKKDSVDCRVILNLKVLNEFIYKTKFKLEGYDVIINML